MMKVALLTPYWPPCVGGISSYVSRLKAHLESHPGVEVNVITRSGDPSVGVSVIPGSSVSFARRAARELRQWQPDVVHAHAQWQTLFAALLYRLRRPGTRVLFTVHTEIRVVGLRRRLLRFLFNRCDAFTCVSETLLGGMSRRFRIRVPTAVTYAGGVAGPPSPARAASFRERHGLALAGPIVSFVGPLVYPRKSRGVATLIDAWAKILRDFPRAQLLILGNGPSRGDLEARADRLGIQENVRFLPDRVDPEDVYHASDVYAHVSYQEGLPLSLLDAMAAAKPIVASANGGMAEVLWDARGGILVDGNVEGTYRALHTLLSNPELRAMMGRQAAEKVAATFTWSATARRCLRLYGATEAERVVVSIDLEEDYPPGDPPSFRGVEEGVPRLLEGLSEAGIQAEWFVTEAVAQRFPQLLARILERGDFVGSHGSHAWGALSLGSFAEQRCRLFEATEASAAAMGRSVERFRAPNFSVGPGTIGAIEFAGFRSDHSILPGRHVRRARIRTVVDHRGAPVHAYHPSRSAPQWPGFSMVTEYPISSSGDRPGQPVGLGFLNARGIEATLDAMRRSMSEVVTFLIHPWEAIDPPRGASVPDWMHRGCSSDLSSLKALFSRIREARSSLGLAADGTSGGQPRWLQGVDPSVLAEEGVHIVFVTSVPAVVLGGISSYLLLLRRFLESRGIRVHWIAYPAPLVYAEAAAGLRRIRKIFHLAFAAFATARILVLRLRHPRIIVHSHGASFCLLSAVAARAFGCRGLHTFHSPLLWRSRLLEVLAHRLDAIIHVSHANRRLYEEHTGVWNDRTAIIPGTALPSALGEGTAPSSAAPRLLFVGRVNSDKGVDLLLPAAARLRDRFPGLRIDIVGPSVADADVAYRNGLILEIARLGLADCVVLHGDIDEARKAALIAEADLVVVPSRWPEPAPMVVFEAMSQRKPLVVSDGGGLPEFVEDGRTGLLFRTGDAIHLTRQLEFLLADESLRRRVAVAAKDRFEADFAPELFLMRHASAYFSILD